MAPHVYALLILKEAFRIWREEPGRFLLFGAFITGLNLLCSLASIPGVVIFSALQGPLGGGLVLATIAVREGRRPGTDEFLGGSTMMKPLLLLSLITSLISLAGFTLLVVPGLVVSTLWICAIPWMMQRGGNTWQAMKASQQLVMPVFFSVFLVELLMAAAEALVSLPLLQRLLDQEAMNTETMLPVLLAQCLLIPFGGILATLVYLKQTGDWAPDNS